MPPDGDRFGRPVLRAAVVSAAALLGAACGGGDSDEVERIEAALDQGDEFGEDQWLSDASPEQQRCLVDRFEGSGRTIIDALSDATSTGQAAQTEVLEVIIECIPNLGELDSAAEYFATVFGATIGPGADIDADESGCLVQYVVDNSSDPAAALNGISTDFVDIFVASVDACFDETSTAAVYGEEGTGPQAYGDDPGLDALYDLCADGDDRACDLLFYETSTGTEYEQVADSCGGRAEPDQLVCTDGVVLEPDGFADPTSPGMIELETECVAGDMIACDTLYSLSPIGSDAENVGFTCGGKIAVGAIPNCRTRFGS